MLFFFSSFFLVQILNTLLLLLLLPDCAQIWTLINRCQSLFFPHLLSSPTAFKSECGWNFATFFLIFFVEFSFLNFSSLRIKQDTQRDGLPTDHKIFLGYPPFQITSHNSQFNSFEYSSSYVDGLPTEHQFFLEVSALSFNFAQLPF
jgi:hypothetical protein